ncbi:hypothetical protein KQX54_004194 [Cotesia glomerata]|uniref:Uncharacterized protein n=1 Tax=Cotesia glomerata TaxID=32391 RepID=A0AAV7HVH9_COTGL|nr:hypothetical protein KQX54_004194 [Cotesia glomerata]
MTVGLAIANTKVPLTRTCQPSGYRTRSCVKHPQFLRSGAPECRLHPTLRPPSNRAPFSTPDSHSSRECHTRKNIAGEKRSDIVTFNTDIIAAFSKNINFQ